MFSVWSSAFYFEEDNFLETLTTELWHDVCVRTRKLIPWPSHMVKKRAAKMEKQQCHRSGVYKQKNKVHKHGKHRTKGEIERENKGKLCSLPKCCSTLAVLLRGLISTHVFSLLENFWMSSVQCKMGSYLSSLCTHFFARNCLTVAWW